MRTHNSSYRPFTLLFYDKNTEAAYLKYSLKSLRFQIHFLLILSACTVGISAWRQIASDEGELFFLIQKIVFIALSVFQIVYPFEKKNQFELKEFLLVITGALSLIFVALKVQTDVDVTGNLFFGIVILQLVAIFLLFGIKFFYILFISVLFLASYELSPILFEGNSGVSNLLTNKILVYSAVLLSGLALYSNEKQKRDNFNVGYLLRITNKKLKEYSDELTKNEQTTKLVLEQIPELVVAVSGKGEILFWNKKCISVTGYSDKDVIGSKGFDLLFPDENLRYKNIKLFTSDQRHREFETRLSTKSNTRRIISWTRIKPYQYISDSPNWYVGKDITDEYDTWKDLQKVEQKLKQTQDLALIGTWEWEPVSGDIIWSEQMYKMFRSDPSDKYSDASKIFSGLLNEHELRRVAQDVLKPGENHKSKFTYEYTVTLNNSEQRVMHIQGQIIYNERGKIMRVFGTNQDITAIKKTENQLRSISISLEYAQKISKLGNIEYNPRTKKVYVSKEINRIFGLQAHHELNFPEELQKYTSPNNYMKIIRFLEKQPDTDTMFSDEIEIETLSGQKKVLSVIIEAYSKKSSEYLYSLIFQDNTELRRAITALEESKLKFQNILVSSPDPILVFDSNFVIQEVNNAVEKVFGYSTEKLMLRSLEALFNPENFNEFSNLTQRLDNEIGTVKNLEFTMLRAAGDKFPAEISLALIPETTIKSRLYVAIIKDITGRKIFEDNLNEARQKAEDADRLKSAFLANMSHEIRTPMNAIVGFSRMLTQDGLSAKEREEYSGYIASNSSVLLTLIDDIIDISKIEAGQIKIKYRFVSVSEILKEVFLIGREQIKLYDKHNVELINSCTGNIPDTPVKVDKTRLVQVFTNLITNAVKFTDQGFVKCKCEIVKIYENKYIQFSVEDTGIGIRRENIGKIFNQFYRIENNDVSEYRGTGLGLALSKRLLTLMGGKISVESEPGKGSIFTFTIPYNPGDATDRNVQNEVLKSKRPDWKGKTIIIAEDDYTNYKYLESLFLPTGVRIIHAPDGRSAIDFFRIEPDTDLILMDIRMPDVDGYEATAKIKSMKQELPVIAVTAFAMSDEKQEILSFQFDDYVSKPINSDILISKMNRLMKIKQ